jgi:hypothetical protein
MLRRGGWLILATLAAFAVMYLPLRLLVPPTPMNVIVLAALLSLLPGWLIMAASLRLAGAAPEVKVLGVILVTLLRMGAVIGGGIVMVSQLPSVREHGAGFIAWVIVFYLATLFVETRMLYIDNSASSDRLPDG